MVGNAFASDVSIAADYLSNYHQEIVKKSVNKITTFFARHGYSLNGDIQIIVVNSHSDYEITLKRMNFSPKQIAQLSRHSSGVTFDNTILVVYDQQYLASDVRRLIAHELTHQYQFAKYGIKATENMWMFEGAAEYVGYYFYHGIFPRKVRDRGIPQEELMSYVAWQKSQKKYGGEKVYEQCLFYYLQHLREHNKELIL